MERRVAGIIRWLERCIRAYKDGAVESALMDVECARADIETLRGDLWKKLERRHHVCSCWFSSFKAAEALLWALGMMLITATPLALQQDRFEGRTEGNSTLEWITPDERELLSNLRRRPDEPLALIVVPEELIVEPQIMSVPMSARAAEPARRRSPDPPPSEQNEQKKPEINLTYDSILALIETGERAMKNEAPAIKVESANGE